MMKVAILFGDIGAFSLQLQHLQFRMQISFLYIYKAKAENH